MRRRFKLQPFTVRTVMSLVVCLIAALLWWRSHNHDDSCQYTTSPYKPVQHLLSVVSWNGRVLLYFNSFYSPNLLMGGNHGDYEDWGWTHSSSGSVGANDREHWMTWSPDSRFGFQASFTHDEKGAYRDIYVPYYLLVLGGGAAAYIWGNRRWRISKANRRSTRGLCPNCAYDLRATRAKCPECGWVPRLLQQPQVRRNRSVRWATASVLGLTLAGAGVQFWRADSREHPLPVLSPEAIAKKLNSGMDASEFDDLTREKASDGQYDPPEVSSKGIEYLLRRLGDGVNVIYAHHSNRIAINSPMETVEVVRFSDLRPDISRDLFDEVTLIHLSPTAVGMRFNPVALIRAVNGLRAAGKEKSLRAMKEYQHLIGGDWERSWRYDLKEERILLIARLLFAPPENDPPLASMENGFGLPDIKPSGKEWPFLPLVVQDDIPFCLLDGYFDASDDKSVSKILDYCESACSLRQAPLRPDVLPLMAADRLRGSDSWQRHVAGTPNAEQLSWMVRIQAMWAVTDLMKWHRGEDWSDLKNLSPETGRTVWTHLLHDERLAGVRWDAALQTFVRTASSN